MCVRPRRSGSGKFLFWTLLWNLFAVVWIVDNGVGAFRHSYQAVGCCRYSCVWVSSVVRQPIQWMHTHSEPSTAVCGHFMVKMENTSRFASQPTHNLFLALRNIQAKLLLLVIHIVQYRHSHSTHLHRGVILTSNYNNMRSTMNVWNRTAFIYLFENG